MRICSKSLDGRHNFMITGQDCYNGCGVNQHELSYGKPKEEESPFDIGTYLARKQAESLKETKARNYMEEIAWRYVPKLGWANDTFFADYKAFWMACNIYWNRHLPFEFEKLLEWGSGKGVHPRAMVGLFLKK